MSLLFDEKRDLRERLLCEVGVLCSFAGQALTSVERMSVSAEEDSFLSLPRICIIDKANDAESETPKKIGFLEHVGHLGLHGFLGVDDGLSLFGHVVVDVDLHGLSRGFSD